MKFADLFCGIGGFHQALANMNMECVFACDIDEACRRTYEANYGIVPSEDVRKADESSIPSFDVLCAGFPCQPFSKAGFQKGFGDDRGNLFLDICRMADFHRPRYMILENVRNLASHDSGNTWKVIKAAIGDLGYHTYEDPLILNALDFGVPQNRERVIIMCKRKDLGELPPLPEIPKKKPCANLKDILCDHGKNRISGKLKIVEEVWDEFVKILASNSVPVPKFPVWTDWWDGDGEGTAADTPEKKSDFYSKYKNWIDKNRDFYSKNKSLLEPWLHKSRSHKEWKGAVRKFEWQAGDLKPDDGMSKVLWTARGSGIRVKRPDYAPTLVALSQVPVYGPESRRLTPRELLRLQSFPDSFKYDEKAIYKQVGNAVNVKMIERCARFLILNESLFEGGGQDAGD
jgi:DNA (cytosine-5)-methyltransferase 1